MPAKADIGLTCVHRLFEQQVAHTPHAPAVAFEGETLSFMELNARADRLADVLQAYGIGPEERVALFVERSLDLAVAVLGVLKAGGAYVPLDPEQPSRRQAFILEDSQPLVIVTQSDLRTQLPTHQAKVICVDSYGAEPTRSGNGSTNANVGPGNLAYVLYTSGSTGRPKGVAIEHRQLLSYLYSAAECYQLHDSASYAMVQTIAVDTSITSMYSPWLSGGCLHVLSRECSLDPQRLADYCRHEPIDCLKIAPSHLAVLLESSCGVDLLPHKHLILGGEPPTWDLIERIQSLRPECAIINEYGPTETTVGVIACHLNTTDRPSTTPPIGLPIGDTVAHILDDCLQPVHEGNHGELFIGGNQLARGYFKQPELTARAFIANPFSTAGHTRLYRTGDLVRRLPDGNLEFLGRRDRQIKIRGFRVELGEVEGVLSEHGAVCQAVVEPYTDPAGRTRLVAYVVAQSDHAPPAARLLRYLGQRLPAHMVPSSVVFLDALPLLSQGKVDRNALPLPEDRRAYRTKDLTPARTPRETTLLEIWQETLAVLPIGINENFFDLGGDSLLAVKLLMKIRQTFDRDVSILSLFDSPTVERLAKVLDTETHVTPTGELAPIVSVPRDRDLPLSYCQERVWFIHQTNPETVAYSYGTKLCFEGELNVQALEKSLTEEVRRHEIYRTSFHDSPTGPVQRVHPAGPVDLPIVDLRTLPDVARQEEAERHVDRLVKLPFDLGHSSLVRWTLLRLDAHTHWLIHVENHLVHDGWSTDLFIQELVDIYSAFSRNRPSPLVAPPIQYGDFACWERVWIQSLEADRQRDFWKNTLAGCQLELPLPVVRRRPKWQTYRGQRHIIRINDSTWQQLCAMARREGSTAFMAMLAVFYVLLHRYTGQTDINVGTGVANRRRPEVENVLGMFINNLVLRLNLVGNPSFHALLRTVREVVLQAFDHQELPFNHVVDMVGVRPDLSRNPLYQVMFSFHDTPMPDLSVPEMRVTMEPSLDTATSKFDLGVIVYPAAIQNIEADLPATEGPTWMIWEYNDELFDAATIERMAGHFLTLIDQAIAAPTRPMAELTALTGDERKQLLEEWNQTQTAYMDSSCVHELFEAQVVRTPHAVALVFDGGQLTYRELNIRANQLADYLRRLGLEPETPVGLCVERSPEMVVGIFAILKAGGTYVPLDPAYPQERLAFMLMNARIGIVLTQYPLLDRLPDTETQVVCLDRDWSMISAHSADNATNGAALENIAYVIYTSGSTGQPKGVAVSHSAIGRNCRIMADHYGLRPEDRVLQFSRFGFDQSLDQILLPLSCGAGIFLPDDGVLDPIRLADMLSRYEITVLNLPPAYWRQWIQTLTDQGEHSYASDLRLVIVGGDAMPSDGVRMWKDLSISRSAELLNAYGPTEATITTTTYRVSDIPQSDFVPIGRPIPGRSVYILDRHLQPVPVGAAGELHVGGTLLARGYFNRPELTAEKFIPDPFCDEPGARLYKTGDLARYRPDGNIEFLGRIDHQVKIRGFRNELGEIEAVLAQHHAVSEAVVNVDEPVPGDKRLTAYVVAGSEPFPRGELRRFVKQKLPDYMVPSAFVQLQAMPLTPAGKVDRRALRAPDVGRIDPEDGFVAPRTSLEKTLTDIWADVLGRKKVGIHESFFELGGHSIHAMQLISRTRKICSVDLPIRTIFESPTVAELARAMELIDAAGAELSHGTGATMSQLSRRKHRQRRGC